MKKKLSIILSLVLVACMLTAVFAFTASAEVATPEYEVVTPMFVYDFETDAPTVGTGTKGISSDTITNRDFMIVDPTVVEDETPEVEEETPASASEGSEGTGSEGTGSETPVNTNKYGKLYATGTAAHGAAASVRYDISPAENIQFAETNYITFDIDIASENGYFDGGSTAIYFNTRKADGTAATGANYLTISRFLNQWYINTSSGSYVVADDNEWFHLSIIIDVEPDTQEGYGDSVGYIYVNGVDTGLTNKVFGDASAYLNSVRINSDANVALASVDRSICFDNIVLNKVTDSIEGDEGSLAWLAHNDMPLTDWYATVYTDGYVLPENFEVYEGMPKALWYKVENGVTIEYSTTNYSDLSDALDKEGNVEVHLLTDFIIANETTGVTTGPNILTLSKAGTKDIYLHGHTLQHNPQYQGALARGQFFYISCTGELTINFYGGTEEEGMGTLSRVAAAQTMLRGSKGNQDNVKINMYGVNLTTEGSTGGYISDGCLYGTDFYFEDCYINATRAFSVKSKQTTAGTDASNIVFKNCDMYFADGADKGTFTGANTVVTYEDCRISTASGVPAIKFSSSPKAYIKGNTVINTATLSNSNNYITVGEGVTVSDAAILNGVKYEEACYLTSVTESIPPEEEGGVATEVTTYKVMKATLPLMYANLTLYSDFNYNLYVPTNAGITTLDGVDVTTLPVETVYGVECYVYTVADINVVDAANDITVTVVGTVADDANASAYTAKKTVSVLAYAKTVLESTDADVVEGQPLVVDMLKYISEAYAYFTEANAEVDALLEGRTPTEYAPTETEVANYADLATYLKGAYVSLDGNCPKYVFVAAGAYKVTVTYTTIDGSTVTVEKTFTAEDETLEVEMRAYDLYKTLSITAETVVEEGEAPVSASGEYNLYTYIQDVTNDTDADNDASLALLKALYNFSKSAEAYKLG